MKMKVEDILYKFHEKIIPNKRRQGSSFNWKFLFLPSIEFRKNLSSRLLLSLVDEEHEKKKKRVLKVKEDDFEVSHRKTRALFEISCLIVVFMTGIIISIVKTMLKLSSQSSSRVRRMNRSWNWCHKCKCFLFLFALNDSSYSLTVVLSLCLSISCHAPLVEWSNESN